MPVPILKTKLFAPPVRSDAVFRKRLQEDLAAGVEGKVTLVSAPAGFGKTTAVALWAAEHPRLAWLSLDSDDNDLRRFLTYLAAALGEVEERFGEGLREVLGAAQLPDAQTLVALLTEPMHRCEPFLLVLDDVHTIDNPAIYGLLETLLAYLPAPLHLVLVTREDPPLPLARLRARGELNEIRSRDLRFSEDEARAFLNEAMGLALTEEQIARLEARTEGWIAGLQLAALSLQNTPDRGSFVEAFAGDDRYVLDYLMDEVFARQPQQVQRFLLQTSILERLQAELCAAVVEIDDLVVSELQSLLEHLEASNLFLIPLDNRREWYRYHHLFADLLRYRLEQQRPALVPELHRRAGAWYEENGYLRQAVQQARAAGDEERVAHLIAEHAASFFADSEMETVLKWLEALPQEVLERRLSLLMIRAWAALSTGHPRQTERSLARIESRLEAGVEALSPEGPELSASTRGALAEVAVMRAVVATGRDEAGRAVALSHWALPLLSEDAATLFHRPLDLRGVALANLAMAYEMQGNLPAAREAGSEAVAVSRREGNPHIVALATARLGRLSALQGKLHEAQETYRRALAQAQGAGPGQTPYRALAHSGLGRLFYEWNDLQRAQEHVDRAISLARPIGHWESLVPAYVGLARLEQARGEGQAALAALDELQRLRRRFGLETTVPAVEAARATLHVRQGDVAAAARWSESISLPAGEIPLVREKEALAQVRVLIAHGRAEQALTSAGRLLAQAEAGGRQGRVVEILVLRALALEALERRAAALESIGQALVLARPAGYVRTFVDEGRSLATLLYAAAGEGLAPEYAGRLLAAFEGAAGPVPQAAAASQELVEPLTEREVQVLELVAQGLTNREIAQELSIALGTVKVHTYNIYGKLDVGNRTEAVARARMLGVLPSS